MKNKYFVFFIILFNIVLIKFLFKDTPKIIQTSEKNDLIFVNQSKKIKQINPNRDTSLIKDLPIVNEIESHINQDEKIESIFKSISYFEEKLSQMSLSEINKMNSKIAVDMAQFYEFNLNQNQFEKVTNLFFETAERTEVNSALKNYFLVNLYRLENKYLKWSHNLFQKAQKKLSEKETEKINKMISILGS